MSAKTVCHSHGQLLQTDVRLLASGNELNIIIPAVLMGRKKWPKELPYQTPCDIVYVFVFVHTFNEFIIFFTIRNSTTIFTRARDLFLSGIGGACTLLKSVSCLLEAEKSNAVTLRISD